MSLSFMDLVDWRAVLSAVGAERDGSGNDLGSFHVGTFSDALPYTYMEVRLFSNTNMKGKSARYYHQLLR